MLDMNLKINSYLSPPSPPLSISPSIYLSIVINRKSDLGSCGNVS